MPSTERWGGSPNGGDRKDHGAGREIEVRLGSCKLKEDVISQGGTGQLCQKLQKVAALLRSCKATAPLCLPPLLERERQETRLQSLQ